MDMIPQCDWSHPGENRFTGNVARAVSYYTDIPEPVRNVLVARVKALKYDDVATVTKAGIKGREADYTGLRQMYFGVNKRCEKVVMPTWPFDQVERGMLFTEFDTAGKSYTIFIPNICGNVSRVDRVAVGTVAAAASAPFIPQGTGIQVPAGKHWWRIGKVSEPGTLWGVAIALAALALVDLKRPRR